MSESKRKYPAVFTYKTNDEIESKILNTKLVKIVMEVYMPSRDFVELIEEKEGKSFNIIFE